MSFSFSSLTFTDEELAEIHEALLMRAAAEDELRYEEGLEPVAERPLLAKIEELATLRGVLPERVETKVEDELWRYAWYVVTDEFAWRRAKTETLAELGERAKAMDPERIEYLARQRYDKRFEEYVAEIERLYGVDGKKARGSNRPR